MIYYFAFFTVLRTVFFTVFFIGLQTLQAFGQVHLAFLVVGFLTAFLTGFAFTIMVRTSLMVYVYNLINYIQRILCQQNFIVLILFFEDTIVLIIGKLCRMIALQQ